MHRYWLSWGDGVWIGPYMMIATVALLVLLVILLIREFRTNKKIPSEDRRSLSEILDERSAQAEIDRDRSDSLREFLEK